MKKIVFVDRHDLSYAPFAAFLFQKMLEERSFSESCNVLSKSGRSGYLGSPVNASIAEALSGVGIDASLKRSELLSDADLTNSLVICLSSEGLRAALYHQTENPVRAHLLSSFLPYASAPPYAFTDTRLQTISLACSGLLTYLAEHGYFDCSEDCTL